MSRSFSSQSPVAPVSGMGADVLRLLDAAPVVVLMLDAQGRIEHVNACFERLTGWTLEAIRGWDWIERCVPEREQARIAAVFAGASGGAAVQGNVNPIVCRDGSERMIEWHRQVLGAAAGGAQGVLSIGIDVTERMRAEQLRRDEQGRREALLRLTRRLEAARGAPEIADALHAEIAADVGYRNVWILLADESEQRYRLEGAKGGAVAQLPVGVWTKPIASTTSALLREAARAAGPLVCEDAQREPRRAATRRARRGARRAGAAPLRARGRTVGLLATGSFGDEGVRLPTPEQLQHIFAMAGHAAAAFERIRDTEVLQRSDRRLREAQALAQLGSWDLDLVDGRLEWSDETYRIFEIDPQTSGASHDAFLAAIHPDDRAAVDTAHARAVATRQPYAIRHRLLMGDGRIKWVEERGETAYAPSGQALRSTGTVQDVTRSHLEQQATAAARRQLQMVIDAASQVAITAGDVDGTLLLFNTGAERMLGYSADEVVGRMSVRIFHLAEEMQARAVELSREYGSPVPATQATREPARRGDYRSREWTYVRKDGSHVAVSLAVTVMLDARGEPAGFLGVATDITDRKRAERTLRNLNHELEARVAERTAELVRARDEAERANAAKSEFLSRMSHELRTPMNAILGFAQVLEMDDALPPRQRGFVQEVRRAGAHLLELINELLDLSRIESGRLAVTIGPVDLDSVIEQTLGLVAPLAAARDIALTRDGTIAAPPVLGDTTRLRQILVNLLGNAIKYNHRGGHVALSIERRDATTVRIAVVDDGPGIAPERVERLFQPFERLGAESGPVEGSGIGLALSRHLAEAMGGRMGVQTQAGLGATFWIDMPLGEAPDGDAPQGAGAARDAGPALQVLYIEDNVANLRVVEAMLRLRPALRLTTAMRGEHGLELARRLRPDVILLDIHLPGLDGYAVLDALRTDAATRAIPVIALSADAMPAEIDRGRRAGFADYLTKPVIVDDLFAALDRALRAEVL